MDYDTEKTIVMMGVFGFLGTFIMLLRLIMRKVRLQKFNKSDYLTMAAIVCLMARTAFTTVVVLWGNNNITKEYRATHLFNATDVYQREIGSKLTIVNRIGYNT
jgi:nitrate reductase gamma subunit